MSTIYQRRVPSFQVDPKWIGDEFAFVQRALSRFYDEGTWTPVPVGATVTGTPTYKGDYTKIGRIVHWGLGIVNTGGSTFASTAGTTKFSGFPLKSGTFSDYASFVQDSTGAILGTSTVGVTSSLTVIHFPTFSANGNFISASGWFEM
jgi:hypothetical protein